MDLKLFTAFLSNILYDLARYTFVLRGYLARVFEMEDSSKPFVDKVLFGYNCSLPQAPLLELTFLDISLACWNRAKADELAY
jgi:hypothetical protein